MKTLVPFLTLIILFYIFPFVGFAQNNWTWAVNMSPDTATLSESVLPHQLFADEEAIYTFGTMREEVRIHDTTLYKLNNSSTTPVEYFVAKFDTDGTFEWAANEGLHARNMAMTRDQSGTFHIAGSARYDLYFENDTLDYTDGELFYARYSADWEELYVRQLNIFTSFSGPVSTVLGNAVDHEGNYFIYFLANGQVSLPGQEFPPTGISTEGRYFIAKFNSDDEFQWATKLNSDYIGNLNLELDTGGNIIIGGTFRDYLAIETDTVYTATNSSGNEDVFLGKISGAGNLLWLQDFGNQQSNYCNDLKIDEDDFIYMSGTLNGGEIILDNQIVDPYYFDPYVAKFSPTGNLEWIFLELTNSTFDAGRALFLYEDKIITTGEYANPITFPSDTDSSLTYRGKEDLYVAVYDKDGNFEYVNTSYGSCEDYPKDISIANGQVYILGGYSCYSIVGEDSLYTENVSSVPVSNQYNTFLAGFYLDPNFNANQYLAFDNELFNVYPNPTSGEIHFNIKDESYLDEDTKIRISDINGATFYYGDFSTISRDFNLRTITNRNNVFLISIINNDQTFTQKIILIP